MAMSSKSSSLFISKKTFSFFNTRIGFQLINFVNLDIDSRMRSNILFIILVGLFAFSCIKKTLTNPIPEIEFVDFKWLNNIQTDSAILTLSYNDYDGDLFAYGTNSKDNIVVKTLAFNLDSNKFIIDNSFSYKINQPADGYYKDKSIQGNIYIPLGEFRSKEVKAAKQKIKLEVFMIDMKANKSNVVSTPEYNFQ